MTKALIVTAIAAFALTACGQDASKGAPKSGAGTTTPPASTPPASSTPPAPADAKKDMKK